MFFLAQIAISITLAVLAHVFMPGPKSPKPEAVSDLEAPTAEAGRPIPVVFGQVTVKSPNCLGYWDVETEMKKVKL